MGCLGMEYNDYKLSIKEKLIVIAKTIAVAVTISYLFFDSFIALVFIPLIFAILYKKKKLTELQNRKQELTQQFMEALKNVSTALLAGYSVENSWKEAQKEICLLYGKDSYMNKELDEMNRLIAMNIPVENILEKFAERSGVEEISTFAEIFSFAKRSRGNFGQIIETTTYRMWEKFETLREIQVTVASKKMEQRVMNIIPIGMLAYLKFASGEYMSVMYGNAFGIIFMLICLAMYVFVIYLAEKMLDINIQECNGKEKNKANGTTWNTTCCTCILYGKNR